LRHAVEVVVEHSQARNVVRAAGEPLSSTRKGNNVSVLKPLHGNPQGVIGRLLHLRRCQPLLQPDANAIVGVSANHLTRSVQFLHGTERGIGTDKGTLVHQHVRLGVKYEAGTLRVRRDKSDVGLASSDRIKDGGCCRERRDVDRHVSPSAQITRDIGDHT